MSEEEQERRELLKRVIDRASSVVAVRAMEIEALVILVVKPDDMGRNPDQLGMEIVSCGREDIVNNIKDKLGFNIVLDIPIGVKPNERPN